jgi:hypothetical protein
MLKYIGPCQRHRDGFLQVDNGLGISRTSTRNLAVADMTAVRASAADRAQVPK